MEKAIRKIKKMTSYNVWADKTIIAKADHWPAGENQLSYVVELIMYEDQCEKARIQLNERNRWDDFYDSEESSVVPLVEEQITNLLSTIIAEQQILKELEVRKRKDVFDLSLEEEGGSNSFIMICQYEHDVNLNNSDTGIFIYEQEYHDIWCFPLGTTETEFFQILRTSVVNPGK